MAMATYVTPVATWQASVQQLQLERGAQGHEEGIGGQDPGVRILEIR